MSSNIWSPDNGILAEGNGSGEIDLEVYSSAPFLALSVPPDCEEMSSILPPTTTAGAGSYYTGLHLLP